MPDDHAERSVDLTNCDREPIHLLGRVQSFGCLLAVAPDWTVVQASANTEEVIGHAAEALLGQRLDTVVSASVRDDLRRRMHVLGSDGQAARIYAYDMFGDGRRFDLSIHITGDLCVIEMEPEIGAPNRDDLAMVQPLIARVRAQSTFEEAAQKAALGLKRLTGIDRVMVYRFGEDGAGTVVGEAMEPGMDPYLGLHYPASDIPKQARALYLRNLLRLIGDVDDPTHPILSVPEREDQPLDLSMAVTRAVSPIHIEYLRNMGVGASMSVSILRRGKLWGLFACHHSEAFHVDYQRRSAIELFAQLFSYELAQLETEAEMAEIERARQLHDRLMAQISSGDDIADGFETMAEEIGAVIPHDGIALYVKGRFHVRGSAVNEEEMLGLARFLNGAEPGTVYSTDRLAEVYPQAENFADRAAGILALPISRTPRDYIVLFRREQRQTVTWAGNPEKAVQQGPNGPRLHPRKSFEAWSEVVRGRSAPWRAAEQRAAEALRVTLLEVVLKLSDEAQDAARRAQEQQELLIAELNHRVRNILNLIRGLVSQGRGGATSIEAYHRVLDDRIHALALAHDQLTQTDYSWISIRELIANEIGAFLSQKGDRLKIEGDAVEVSPSAFTTLALVIHELVTNSAKYGALSDSSGWVAVTIAQQGDGAVMLRWVEHDGPPVRAPQRRGFGTTIIERSIPFELKGTAQVSYKVSGLEAEFRLPAQHVRLQEAPAEGAAAPAPAAGPQETRIDGQALVVDDNMIIAMDAGDMMSDLGASRVHTAASVPEALRILGTEAIAFALIDINLGSEISLPVALACREAGIPAILATGYGAREEVIGRYPVMPVVRKPYTLTHVRQAMAELAARSAAAG
ncbi:HWE histidine kinase domain-containing protein [Pseudoroseicyclus aestuarii]|uniref:histidine kinase n=1 Tax=Pseudoroseicyclus aestuarii TaxID=1795041 RepID=A0A318SUT3_9RHOB|nr:HWE histidine kinase domain-containing protein [Pseudoroseicyclus aestuarii]PYE85671.1 light-regulated signal transduction histidine kinase (bacteriophytochrome) [Pseudoroseicyclus aestuarii]